MTPSVTRLRRWLAAVVVLMVAIIAGMYGYARWRVRNALHDIPAKIDVTVQRTAEGFSISKSEQGRTLFTVRASKVVELKLGGVAKLHDVEITIYGKDASRYDRIRGQEFEYDPTSGNVAAKGTVEIDLQGNPQGPQGSDQAPPVALKNPIHVRTDGLVFNKESGNAAAAGKVDFETLQATGSAVGAQYVARTGTMTLLSAIVINLKGPHATQLTANQAVLTKLPRRAVLSEAKMVREQLTMHSDTATLFLRDDNTVDRLLAEGNVEAEAQGPDRQHGRADQAELFLTGSRNLLQTAILTGNVQLSMQGSQPASASAGRATLHFAGQQVLQTVHAEQDVHLAQKKSPGANPVDRSTAGPLNPAMAQDLELTAPVMDFTVKNGRLLERAETSGPPQIVIDQPASHQRTVATAGKFVGVFADNNRLSSLHGEPDARIISSTPAQLDRVSISKTLDVAFLPTGGVASIVQQGGLVYTGGTQKAWAQRGTYTPENQTIVLNGAPRVADGGMTTTAQVIRINRATGEAIADGDVKSSYSSLKTQPSGAMLASDDPIHVTSRSMTAHRSSAAAVYTGNARLWQNANVVESPTLEFDRDQRSLVATGTASQPVATVLVEMDKKGKATPIATTALHLSYNDLERRVYLEGNVTTKAAEATMTAQTMTVFLVPREQSGTGVGTPPSPAGGLPPSAPATMSLTAGTAAKVDHIVAEGNVVVTEPGRRATGERLEYTAVKEQFVLTGGPPSIFDAERGKTTGDSLTFYRHDDRVLVEGRATSPTVTRTRVAR